MMIIFSLLLTLLFLILALLVPPLPALGLINFRLAARLLAIQPLPLLLPLFLTLASCAPARPPIPPGVIPEARRTTQADQEYGRKILQELSDKYKLDYNHPRSNEVRDIVDRLTASAKSKQDPWQVYIFRDSKFKNAAATRGNHVFIWTAMLDSARTEGELATILAHEIGHVLARHTDPDPNEELKRIVVGIGAMAAGIAASYATKSPVMGDTVGNLASGVTEEMGNSLLLYPYSRGNELEADQVGLFILADAGYSPQAAIDFWSRASHDPDFSSSLAFLSTHPPAEERLLQIKQLLPKAQERYLRSPLKDRSVSGSLGSNPQQAGLTPPAPQSIVPDISLPAPPMPAAGKSPLKPASSQISPPPTLGTNDTFAVSGEPATSTAKAYSGDSFKIQLKRYRVNADRVQLYKLPTLKSIPIGEFGRGALVEGELLGVWLKIERPDTGYIPISQLTLAPN